MSIPVIELKHLGFTYPNGVKALDDINISIQKGEFVSIIGQNGAGKSTLLKNITGLLRPTAGSVLVEGKDTRDLPVSDLAKKIGFVLQNPDRQLFASTVEEEIAFGLKNQKLPETEIKERVRATLEMLGFTKLAEVFPPALSKGDRAKVIIASVLAMEPEIVILDEPTSGQDYRGCYQVMDIAQEIHRQGRSVVVVTHHMALVAEYTSRTIVMSKTKVLMDDETHRVFAETDLLASTHIKAPQITQVTMAVERQLSFGKTVLSVEECTQKMAAMAGKRPPSAPCPPAALRP